MLGDDLGRILSGISERKKKSDRNFLHFMGSNNKNVMAEWGSEG